MEPILPEKITQEKFNQLRRQAEELMIKSDLSKASLVSKNPLKLIHELQTFQIELALQNEELKHSQQELMESEIRYTELFDFAPAGYMTLGLNGKILNANLTLADMLSIERSYLINHLFSAYIVSEDQDIYYLHLRHLLESKTRQVCELRLKKKDETPFDVQLESTIVFDEQGEPTQYRTMVIDIFDRKAAEREKLKSQRRRAELEINKKELRQTRQEKTNLLSEYVGQYYDSAPCGYVTLSPEGIITKINSYGLKFLKTDRINIKHRTFSDFVDPACQLNYFMALKQTAKTGKMQSVELKITTMSNINRCVLANIQPDLAYSTEIYQWRLVFVDISEYKRSEILLKQRKDRFEFLFQHMPFACQFLSRDGQIIDVNHCWEKITGYDRHGVVGKDFAEFLHSDWKDEFQKRYASLESGTDLTEFQFVMDKNDGSCFHVSGRVKPCWDKDGGFNYACLCFHPVIEPESKEKQIAPGEEQSFALMEDQPGSMIQLDAAGRIVFANEACRTILGYTPGALKGRFKWDLTSDKKEADHVKEWFRYRMRHQPVPEPFYAKFRTQDGKTLTLQIDWNYKYNDAGQANGILASMTDISKTIRNHYQLSQTLVCQNEKMIEQKKDLEETKAAMTVLAKKFDECQSQVEETVRSSLKMLILPYVEQLKNCRLKDDQKTLVNILESNLHEVTQPFVAKMTVADTSFTPMEIQIAHLVRQGRANKEIAQILTISSRTVSFHRENIRKKLGLQNKKVNLRSVLLSRYT